MPLLTHRHALSGDRDLLQRLSSDEYYGFFWVQMALTDTETQQKLKPLFLTRIFSVREPTISQVLKLWTKPAPPLFASTFQQQELWCVPFISGVRILNKSH